MSQILLSSFYKMMPEAQKSYVNCSILHSEQLAES